MNIKSVITDKNTNIDLEFMRKQINLLNVLSSSATLKKRTKLCPHNFFSTNEIKISENNCVKLKKSGEAVHIKKILEFLLYHAGLQNKKNIQT